MQRRFLFSNTWTLTSRIHPTWLSLSLKENSNAFPQRRGPLSVQGPQFWRAFWLNSLKHKTKSSPQVLPWKAQSQKGDKTSRFVSLTKNGAQTQVKVAIAAR